MMKGKLILGCVLWLCAGVWVQAAQPPELINYQGVLRDADDKPRTGSFGMIFKFFSAEVGGDEILIDTHSGVPVDNGLFNVQLGKYPSDGTGPGNYELVSAVFRDYEEVWLQVEVAGEVLSPRIRVISSAFALNARFVRGQELVTSGPLDLYVDSVSGDDNNSGLTPLKAKRTIQAAVDATPLLLAHKVSIHIAPGYYYEEVVINRPQSGSPFSFEGIGIELLDDPLTPNSVNIVGGGSLKLGLQVVGTIVYARGVRISEFTENGVEVVSGSAVVMENCRLSDNGGSGARVESFLQLQNCEVLDNSWSGITVERGDLEISGTTFSSNGWAGIHFETADGQLDGLTASANQGGGIKLENNSVVNINDGATLSGNSGAGAYAFSGSRLYFNTVATISDNTGGGVTAVDNSSIDFRSNQPVFSGNGFVDMHANRNSSILSYVDDMMTCVAENYSNCSW